MVKIPYRTIQHWDHWLTQFLGKQLLESETHCLKELLQKKYGKHSLLIGVPQQETLLSATNVPLHWLLTPLAPKESSHFCIESHYHELPITSGTVDIVLLPHVLEFIDNPRQVLSEACRIVKPEGYLVIISFNPFSLWGLKKWLAKNKNVPWSGNFIHVRSLKEWLKLADFKLITQQSLLFRPPIRHHRLFQKLAWLETLGSRLMAHVGGVTVLIAQAKVVPLTPIRLNWKQSLASFPVTSVIGR